VCVKEVAVAFCAVVVNAIDVDLIVRVVSLAGEVVVLAVVVVVEGFGEILRAVAGGSDVKDAEEL